MARLSIRLLGTLQATLDGMTLTGFESDKERALLAYLAEESQQPHRREKLAGLLWPERTEAAARNNLRRVLSNLRRLLGDRTQTCLPFLLVAGQTIRFNPDCDAWIDTRTFARLLGPPGPQAITQLEKAIRLYRGAFLEDLSVVGSPACEEWIVLCRERYQRLTMQALHHLVQEYEKQGRYDRALELAWRQLALEPWWEEAHRQLIRLLALSGRRSEALAQYVKCRRVLAEELGAAPSTETTTLYEQIRDDTLAVSVPSPQRRPGPTHNLPLTSGPFVGRQAEIATIQDYLHNPACRLLTLVGAGGMGKTRLALEAVSDWISRLHQDELEGVTLVSLAPLQTAQAIVPAVAQTIGLPLSPGREPARQLLDHLSRKRWLLILDSFEHLLEGKDFVAKIIKAAPEVKVLVTSRARLNLYGEHSIPVGGIQFPKQIPENAQAARTFDAVELFLQATQRVRLGFEPTGADLAEISRICCLMQGMPLGILLAATWMGVLSPAEIAQEIDKGIDFLAADWSDVPERQRSLRAVFDRSWNLLTQQERAVFQALSVFCDGFTRAAAEQITGASLRDLRALTDKSLLQYTPSGRYQIHELVRQYATSKLDLCPGARTTAGDRHCAYYAAALHRWEKDLTGSGQQEALSEMEAESENIRAAWRWAVEHVQIEQLDLAIEGLQNFYWQSGRYAEAEAAYGVAAEAIAGAGEIVAPGTDCLRVEVRALAWQSNFQRAMGFRESAHQLQQRCLGLLQSPTLEGVDTRLERAILSMSRGLTVCMADYAQGRDEFARGFALFRELDNRWGMAWSLGCWGTMSLFLGARAEAKQRFEEGLVIHQALGNASGIAGALSRLAVLASLEGQFDRAERLAREGVVTSLDAGSRTQSALALLDLGGVLEDVAKFIEAHSVLQQCLALFCDLGHRHYITEVHGFLGRVDLHLGRYEEARDHVQTGLALAHEHGPRYCVGENLLLLGCLDLVQGAAASARPLLEESTAVFHEVGHRDDLCVALACLALTAHRLGDTPGARQHLCHALEIAQVSGAVPPLMWDLAVAARLMAAEAADERAVELYALASRYPLVARSRWFADVAGNTVAEVAATLPAERVVILEKRGRARNLEATVEEFLAESGH